MGEPTRCDLILEKPTLRRPCCLVGAGCARVPPPFGGTLSLPFNEGRRSAERRTLVNRSLSVGAESGASRRSTAVLFGAGPALSEPPRPPRRPGCRLRLRGGYAGDGGPQAAPSASHSRGLVVVPGGSLRRRPSACLRGMPAGAASAEDPLPLSLPARGEGRVGAGHRGEAPHLRRLPPVRPAITTPHDSAPQADGTLSMYIILGLLSREVAGSVSV
jgi:hypothetical protein